MLALVLTRTTVAKATLGSTVTIHWFKHQVRCGTPAKCRWFRFSNYQSVCGSNEVVTAEQPTDSTELWFAVEATSKLLDCCKFRSRNRALLLGKW